MNVTKASKQTKYLQISLTHRVAAHIERRLEILNFIFFKLRCQFVILGLNSHKTNGKRKPWRNSKQQDSRQVKFGDEPEGVVIRF